MARGAPGRRAGAQVLPVQALVLEVGEVHGGRPGHRAGAAPDVGHVGAAAVLVHQRARVEADRRDVVHLPLAVTAHHDLTAALQRAQLQPEELVAAGLQAAQRHTGLGDQGGADGRGPGAVGGDAGLGERL